MRLREASLLRDLDKTLAIFGIIFSIFLIVYLGREIGRVIYVLTGILTLISCILWLMIRKSHTFEFNFSESGTQTILCAACFLGLFTLSILSVYLHPEPYERPLIYFVLISLMAGVITWGVIKSDRRHISLILIQVILLGINIAWSQLLIFPSLVGVDPWYHSTLTNRIIDEGFIPEGFSYTRIPLFQLMVGLTSMLTDLPYKFAAMLSVSLGQIICNAVFVFLIANRLFDNHRIGLLASLLVIIANHHIFMSYWSIPNGFGVVFIPIVLYIILSRMRAVPEGNSTLSWTIIMLLLMIAIVFTHTIAAVGMAILLIVAWTIMRLYRSVRTGAGNHVALSIPLGFAVMMFTWWAYASGHIRTLSHLIEWGFSADYFGSSPVEAINYSMSLPLSEELFNNLGMFLFFTLSFIGIFYMIYRRDNSMTFTMSWVMITPLAIGFFSLITGHSVIEHRWWYMAQILLSIPLAIAIILIGSWKSKGVSSANVFATTFIMMLSFLLILSPAANVDYHGISENSVVTYSLDHSELYSRDYIRLHATDYSIMSDQYFYYSQRYHIPSLEKMEWDPTDGMFIEDLDSAFLIRRGIIDEPMKMGETTVTLRYDPNDLMLGPLYHKTYTSNSNNIYLGIYA